mgnify:FL=1|jgi:hypothetical protein
MKNYFILLVLILSIPTFAANKVLECKFYNENLASDCPGVQDTNIVQIILNTNDFAKSSASAEFSHMMCHKNYIADKVRIPMEVTSTTLSFLESQGSWGKTYWNIDRKTLKGGWNKSRKATCNISDLDTSDNQI